MADSQQDIKELQKLLKQGLNLTSLSPASGSRKKRKRLGIGEGSGNGKTCGKGQKGQTSRSGGRIPRGFEGGQMPLYRRMPKQGFVSRQRVLGKNVYSVVSLARLGELSAAGMLPNGLVNVELLQKLGVVPSSRKTAVKILLGHTSAKEVASFNVKLTVVADAFSATAKQSIEAAGGQAVVKPSRESGK